MPIVKCVLLGKEKEKRPFVTSWITTSNSLPTSVLFLVDTGSDKSILSANDARRMGINIEDLPEPPDAIGGIGGLVPSKNLGILKGDISLKFMSDGGLYNAVKDSEFIVLRHPYSYKLPSVLGVDFLNEYNFKLHINYKRNCVEFGNWSCNNQK